MAEKTFRIVMSERCYRFKPDALPSHAPARPGVYEFVTFPAPGKSKVLFVGLALEKTVFECLEGHLTGKIKPTLQELLAESKDVYFDYVAQADIAQIDDLKDIARALKAKHNPALNTEDFPPSSRYGAVALEEVETL